MLLGVYEVFDQLIVGGVVGATIIIVALIIKFFKSKKLIYFRSILGILIIIIFSFVAIISSIQNSSFLGLIFAMPLLFLFYWFRKGYFEKTKETEQQNEEIKEEIIQAKENKPTNISSLSDDLTKLGELKEKGLLTEEEFNEQKKKLLKQ